MNEQSYEVYGPGPNGYAVVTTAESYAEYDGITTEEEAQHLADMLNRGLDPRDAIYKS